MNNTVKFVIKYRLLFIALILITWSILTPSKFQKGGIDETMYYIIFTLTFGLSFLYVLPSKDLILFEKILMPLILSFLGLLIMTEIVMDRLLETFYGYDYEFRLWDNAPRIIANLIYYFVTNFMIIGLLKIYMSYRKDK
jgi:hypothetical protein